jgi:thymidylate synthase
LVNQNKKTLLLNIGGTGFLMFSHGNLIGFLVGEIYLMSSSYHIYDSDVKQLIFAGETLL